jgi:hypothetical protein
VDFGPASRARSDDLLDFDVRAHFRRFSADAPAPRVRRQINATQAPARRPPPQTVKSNRRGCRSTVKMSLVVGAISFVGAPLTVFTDPLRDGSAWGAGIQPA